MPSQGVVVQLLEVLEACEMSQTQFEPEHLFKKTLLENKLTYRSTRCGCRAAQIDCCPCLPWAVLA